MGKLVACVLVTLACGAVPAGAHVRRRASDGRAPAPTLGDVENASTALAAQDAATAAPPRTLRCWTGGSAGCQVRFDYYDPNAERARAVIATTLTFVPFWDVNEVCAGWESGPTVSDSACVPRLAWWHSPPVDALGPHGS